MSSYLHMKHSRVSASPRQTQHQCRPVSSAYGNLAAVQGHAGPATACKAVCWDKHAKVSKVSSRGAAVTAQAAACGHNNSLLETPARAYPGWKSRALGGLAARSSAAAEVSTMRGWAAAAMNANATNRRRLVATRATSGGGEHHVESEEDHAYVVMWPRDFAEGAAAVAAMRSGNQSVVLNIGRICADTPGRSRETEQQRLVDFIAGATHALGGTQAALADGVFLFCPAEAPLSADYHATEGYEGQGYGQGKALLSLARLG